MFEEFLQLLGDKVRLRGFDKYKGGLGKHELSFLTFPSHNFPYLDSLKIPFTT